MTIKVRSTAHRLLTKGLVNTSHICAKFEPVSVTKTVQLLAVTVQDHFIIFYCILHSCAGVSVGGSFVGFIPVHIISFYLEVIDSTCQGTFSVAGRIDSLSV